MDRLPAVRHHPPDRLWADKSRKAVAVSAWTGERGIVIGDEATEEWLTFNGKVPQVLENR